jgi:hypothetical protein
VKLSKKKAKLEKRIKAWETIRDKSSKSGKLSFHKPGSIKK